MPVAMYYLSGSLAAFVLFLLSPWMALSIILVWTSLSLLAVGLAYLFNYPALFRKRADGSIPIAIRWLFIPFLFGATLYNYWARKRDKVPQVQKITDQLYLGARLFSRDLNYLKVQGIRAVLDVTAEFNGLDWAIEEQPLHYLNVPVLDHSAPNAAQLNQAINWLHQQHRQGRKVLVHCALGRGRSVLVAAAYLLATQPDKSANEVLDSIRAIRQTARLNRWQFKQLEYLHQEDKLRFAVNAWLIANPVAGGGKWQDCQAQIEQQLAPRLALKIKLTNPDEDGRKLAEQAIKAGADIVIACGGDGTITEVASVLTDTQVPLGIIPMGTANALSYALCGIKSKVFPIDTACQSILEGEVRAIDTARCNGKLILLLAAVGFEQQMIEAANRKEKNALGQFAYLLGLWRAIEQNQNLQLEVQFDDEPAQTLHTHSLVVANAAPLTTLLAQGDGEPDLADGKLDVTWLSPSENSTQHLLSLTELALAGISPTGENIHHRQITRIRIDGPDLSSYVIDGEVFDDLPLDIQIHPASLKVLAPALH
ncbi:diacylglycerol kinase family protein [Bowmanella yangjiangensis]|uniref:Dual specificity protein phosphatase family protein n=1 Tax=Bowmanella yangjiangensis TaxID=2811230 RepID=A0ABS3CQP5_9ALTE|nr:diacylglycerol kinase family protein [Bowmanella yangjiangensis]MBN7818620.1 dual specificity protein phosphatase family protein [Bowmanella yangjiangensis]